ncbi:hypothetical protein, partial [Escherichia coli]|uniref:hypothetical protein n=1 Tax=Escherichia coli TaxID=562 RepID=UPI003F47AE37
NFEIPVVQRKMPRSKHEFMNFAFDLSVFLCFLMIKNVLATLKTHFGENFRTPKDLAQVLYEFWMNLLKKAKNTKNIQTFS